MSAPRRRAAPAVLAVVAGLFLASALVRIVDGVGVALAREPGAAAAPAAAPAPAESNAMIAALNARAERLDEREIALADRMQALTIAEARVAERLAELRDAEASLTATLALADQAAERDLQQLTGVYQSMKPKDAAALFEAMDPEFAAGFVARMETEAAANLLAGLSPGAAYAISVILAGRNVGDPRE
jgi:flagellar motility protein MotE (MotC chaperone)